MKQVVGRKGPCVITWKRSCHYLVRFKHGQHKQWCWGWGEEDHQVFGGHLLSGCYSTLESSTYLRRFGHAIEKSCHLFFNFLYSCHIFTVEVGFLYEKSEEKILCQEFLGFACGMLFTGLDPRLQAV